MVGGAGYAVGKRRAGEAQQEPPQAPAPQQPKPTHEVGATHGGGMSEMDRLDALKKLGELHDSGVLTDDQFDAEKEKLI
jgi:hypothetical protein